MRRLIQAIATSSVNAIRGARSVQGNMSKRLVHLARFLKPAMDRNGSGDGCFTPVEQMLQQWGKTMSYQPALINHRSRTRRSST